MKKDIIFIISLAFLNIIFFRNILFDDQIFFHDQILRYYYPILSFVKNSIENLEIPLWNPYLFSGHPFVGNMVTGIFYPLKFILLIFPLPNSLKFFITIHFFLAGLFIYYLMRDFRLSRPASSSSAFIFTFSGYLVSHIQYLSNFTTIIWLPLIFLLFNRAISHQRRFFYSIFTGIVLSIQFLAGYVPFFLYTLITLVIFILFVTKVKKKPLLDALLIFWLSLMVCLGLSMLQLLPTLELTFYSTRAEGLSFDEVTFYSLPPIQLITFLIPFFFGKHSYWGAGGDPYLMYFYLGIFPLLLVSLAIILKKDRYTYFFLFILLSSILMALGKFTPLYKFLYHYLPGFNLFRIPTNSLLLTTFSISILAGIGLDEIIHLEDRKRDNVINFLKFFIYPFIIFLLTIFIVLCIFKEKILLIFSAAEDINIQLLISRYFDLLNSYQLMLIFFCLSALLLTIIVGKKKMPGQILKFTIILLVIVDLFYFGKDINPTVSSSLFTIKPENIKFLEEQEGYFRILMTPKTRAISTRRGKDLLDASLKFYDTLYPNTAQLYRIFDADGYGGLMVNHYMKLLSALYSQQYLTKSRLLDLLNVRYIFSFYKMDKIEEFNLVREHNIKIYENKNYLPRTFIVYHHLILNDKKKIIKKLLNEKFDPTQIVILEDIEESSCSHNIIGNKGSAKIVEYKINEVKIKTYLPHNGYLILLDTYYPGWNVFIDGEKGKILKAYYAFRAVFLKKGNHIVRFVYNPLSFKLGLVITFSTIILIIAIPIAIQIVTVQVPAIKSRKM